MVARTFNVRGLIFARPSDTIQTTTFFHASAPQVRDRLRAVKWRMFFMTPCIVLVNRISSSYNNKKKKEKENARHYQQKTSGQKTSVIKALTLYIVMAMNSSVSRGWLSTINGRSV